jgi:hypothetical protein
MLLKSKLIIRGAWGWIPLPLRYSIVSGAEDFKCSFQTRQVPGHWSFPQSGRTHKAVTGGFQILERTQG